MTKREFFENELKMMPSDIGSAVPMNFDGEKEVTEAWLMAFVKHLVEDLKEAKKWHTEKPTEDGTFLVLWDDTEEPWRRYSVLHWNEYNDTWYDEETPYCNWGDEDHAEVIAWQKIAPYEEDE